MVMDTEASTNLPWVEKYRPNDLNELISQDDTVDTIDRFMDKKKLPHLLFYGPPGTGKTSMILACAKKLYKNKVSSMVLELNASDDRGINIVREKIKDFASTQMIYCNGFKLIILDEADAMTQAAQAALRRIIEKYTNNVRFCIICNYVTKIIPALQSRCTKFRFAPLEIKQIRNRLDQIIEAEKVNITTNGKDALLKVANGDMRRVLNLAQACHSAFDIVTEREVYICSGLPLPEEIERILDWLLNSDFTSAYNAISKLKQERGLALIDLITELYPKVLEMEISSTSLSNLLNGLGKIECDLAAGATEEVQLTALVATFKFVAEMDGIQ